MTARRCATSGPSPGRRSRRCSSIVGESRLFLIALGFIAGHTVVALSHAALQMLNGVFGIIFHSAARIGLPGLCAERRTGARLAETYGELAQLQALLGLPMTVGTALVAPAMVQVLLGPESTDVGSAAQVVGLHGRGGRPGGQYRQPVHRARQGEAEPGVAVVSLSCPWRCCCWSLCHPCDRGPLLGEPVRPAGAGHGLAGAPRTAPLAVVAPPQDGAGGAGDRLHGGRRAGAAGGGPDAAGTEILAAAACGGVAFSRSPRRCCGCGCPPRWRAAHRGGPTAAE